MTASEILVAEAVYYRGNWKAIVDAINQKKILPVDDIIRINKSIRCKTLTILDKDYPEYLKELYQPPLVLFYYGDISLINNPKTNLAIVGTRKPSEALIPPTDKSLHLICILFSILFLLFSFYIWIPNL